MKTFSLHLTITSLLLFCVCGAQGRVFIVTGTSDSAASGTIKTTRFTSLRGAIIAANRAGGFNTILLQPKTYRLAIPGADEDNAFTGDLDITRGNLTILPTSGTATIDATGLGDRVLQVFSQASLTLANVTITGGTARSGEYARNVYGESGGAVYNAGTLLLKNCAVTNNASGNGGLFMGNAGGVEGSDGGGIYNTGNLTMENCLVGKNICGAGTDGASGGNGGGICNRGACLLNTCTLVGNAAGAGGPPEGNAFGLGGGGGNGGGLANFGTMIMNNCTVGGNYGGAGANGGQSSIIVVLPDTLPPSGGPGGDGGGGAGLYNAGRMKLSGCTIAGNDSGHGGTGGDNGAAGNGGQGGSGGGILNSGNLVTVTCTISGNYCGSGGNGGNDEFSGASGGNGGSGGGIFSNGPLNATSCTVVLNETGAGGNGGVGILTIGGLGGEGGGVSISSATMAAAIRDSLVALNTVNAAGVGQTNKLNPQMVINGNLVANTQSSNLDLSGAFASGGFNLIGAADGSTGFTNGIHADQAGSVAAPIDPRIGPLQMNGGLTPTHALLSGSPAIDQGNSSGIHTDQRGHRRPHDYPFIANTPGGDGSDIGAFELDSSLIVPTEK